MTTNRVQSDYIKRINAAIDYIIANLDGELNLETIAKVARFSPFHFHRIFKSMQCETLNEFIKRQRLERALYLMSHASDRSLTEIAHECGFSSASDFSRSFKNRFGAAPSEFDLDRLRSTRRDELENAITNHTTWPHQTQTLVSKNPDKFEVYLRDLPARTVAYIRVVNPYQSDKVIQACQRLIEWAEHRGLGDGEWLGYMWDEPEIVALEKCRYDVAVVVDENRFKLRPEGEVGRFEFPPMQVAEIAISGDIHLEKRAFDWLYDQWLPTSGYIPDNHPSFEAWHSKPLAHGLHHFELSCQLPVKRGSP